jgi:predicted ATPase
VRELIRDLAEGRDPRDSVPETIRDVVRARVARLDKNAQALVAAGAVAGATFDAETANAVLDEPLAGAGLATLVDVLVGAGLVNDSEPGNVLRFEHTLVRDAIYGNLTVTRRSALHVALAERLMRIDGSRSGPHLVEIAHHFRAAGSASALEWTITAADYAFDRVAFDQAARLYGHAIAALQPGDDRRLGLVRRRAMASQLLAHAIIDARSSPRA